MLSSCSSALSRMIWGAERCVWAKPTRRSGLPPGLRTGSSLRTCPAGQLAMLTVFTAGLAVLPDIDHPEATMAHSFGFLTKLFAEAVGRISGGHRWGTHSFLGAGILAGLAVVAVHWRHDVAGRVGLCFLLALTFAAVFVVTMPGRVAVKRFARLLGFRRHAAVKHVGEAAAIGLAIVAWRSTTGWGLALVGLATILGCGAHIGADMLTKERCPLLLPAVADPVRAAAGRTVVHHGHVAGALDRRTCGRGGACTARLACRDDPRLHHHLREGEVS